MSNRNRYQWLVVSMVILISFLSGYYSYAINPSKYLLSDDGVVGWEDRMKPVRDRLPPTVHEIGYLSDNDSTAILQEYTLTRYSLAPIIVRQGGNYEWIVGNFTQPGFEEIIRSNVSSPYEMDKLGAGIYLIHKINP